MFQHRWLDFSDRLLERVDNCVIRGGFSANYSPTLVSLAAMTQPDWSTAPPRVLCVGLSTLDQLWRVAEFPPSASRTPANAHRTSGGGAAATAAVAAARLGAAVSLWATVGADAAGDVVVAELADWGVDVSGVRRLAGGRTAVSAVLVAPSGERHIFPFYGDAFAEAPLGDVDWRPLERAGAVLVDLYVPGLTRAVLRRAREAGVPSVGDVSNTKNWELTRELDHLIASQECAAAVLGRDDPYEAVVSLRQRPGQVVGITLGQQGMLLDAGDGVMALPACAVTVVDTTGAGDVFHGAYAFGVAAGWPALHCAEVAAAAAALSCTGVGRSAIPDAAAVRGLLG